MKNKYKILISLIITAIIFLTADFCSYVTDWNELKKQHEKFGTYLPDFSYSYILDKDPYSYILQRSTFRKPLNEFSKLEPIYIFGCSFAYGEKLKDNETFGAKLAAYTGRPVYNFAYPGFSIQHMLYQLENMKFPPTKQPKYIIYVYISDHLRRMRTEFIQPEQTTRYPLYKEKNGELVFKKISSLSPSIFYIARKFKCFYAKYMANSKFFYNKNMELLEKHFLKAEKLIHKKYPGSQFIIILYNPDKKEQKYSWKNLKKKNVKIISTDEIIENNLNNDEYKLKDSHPSKKVWEVLTPVFLKSLE